jgi:hypothetical protein
MGHPYRVIRRMRYGPGPSWSARAGLRQGLRARGRGRTWPDTDFPVKSSTTGQRTFSELTTASSSCRPVGPYSRGCSVLGIRQQDTLRDSRGRPLDVRVEAHPEGVHMPDRQLRTAGTEGPRQWRAVGELGQSQLSVKNDVSRGIGQSARVPRTVGKISARERPSPRTDMFCS